MQRRPFVDPISWFCVHTHPGKESFAQERLLAQKFEVFYPQIEIKRPKKAAVLRPFFPRYLFVGLSKPAQQCAKVKYTPGVSYILSHYETEDEHTVDEIKWELPQRMNARIISQLRQMTAPIEHKPNLIIIKPGMLVKVISGPLQNTEAVCSWSEGERVKLLVNMLSSQHELEFSHSQLALV